jgi:hypothetical protein
MTECIESTDPFLESSWLSGKKTFQGLKKNPPYVRAVPHLILGGEA